MITITGATGQTGSKIANLLLDEGKKVRVIGRTEEKLLSFKGRGAEIAVGDQGNVTFLTGAFTGSEAVYLMIPPKTDAKDIRHHYNIMGDVAVKAIRKSGVKKVVFLSSLGAELKSGTGPVVGLHDVERKLAKLTSVDLAVLRAGYFMENTLMNASLIKDRHILGNTVPPDAYISMVATRDIAKRAGKLLTDPLFTGHRIIDLFGDRISYKEAARELGEALGIVTLSYVQFPDDEAIKNMVGMGLSKNLAHSFIELSLAIGKGRIQATQIDPSKPNATTTFKEFTNEVLLPALQKAA